MRRPQEKASDKKMLHSMMAWSSEKRQYLQLELSPEFLEGFPGWQGLQTIVQVISNREATMTKKRKTEVRYYISSTGLGIKKAARSMRQHLGIESMHWVLDTTFCKDASRTRKDR